MNAEPPGDACGRFNQGGSERWPFERFYCGCPLVTTNGLRVGTLCLGGDTPRKMSAHEVRRRKHSARLTLACRRKSECVYPNSSFSHVRWITHQSPTYPDLPACSVLCINRTLTSPPAYPVVSAGGVFELAQ